MLSNIIKKISESLIQKLNFFLFLLPIISILLIYLLNLYFTVKNNYLFPIFFFQISLKYYIINYLIFSIFLIFLFIFYKKKNFNLKNYNQIILIFFTIFFKYFIIHKNIYQFEQDSAESYINNLYPNIDVPFYIFYEVLSYYILKIFNQNNLHILFFLNIFFSSLSSFLVFKISNKIFNNSFISIIIFIFFLCYLPTHSLDTVIRVDNIYMLLFIISIYLTINLINKFSKKKVIFLSINFCLLILCREQTIYFLPIYLLFLLLSKYYLSVVIISLITLFANLTYNNFISNNFGSNFSYKKFHLISKFVTYGYLIDYHKKNYTNILNFEEKRLLNDLELEVKKNIFPTKRISNEIYLENSSPNTLFKDIVLFIKPMEESIHQLITPHIPKKILIGLNYDKLNLINEINSLDETNLNINRYSSIIKNFDFNLDSKFFSEKIYNETQNCFESNYDVKICTINEIKRFYDIYIYELNDSFQYSRIGIKFAFNYKEDQKKILRTNHPNIDSIENIIIKYPLLYITQSTILFLGSSTTRMLTEPINIGRFHLQNFKNGNFFELLLSKIQNFYMIVINFYYIFSFLIFIIIIFKDLPLRAKLKLIFLTLLPIYYGLFISFATFEEFSRLMLVISPVQIINFFIFIFLILRKKNNLFNK